ncbi:hypothetical protein [Streptomyces sp. NPDC002054]|uniref:hypothetical protein n=1 Tax=Streptomyces sp. NPDC002054 TaxID=3154663 RepID=UPI00331E9ABF
MALPPPAPAPVAAAVARPAYRPLARKKPVEHRISPVTFTLLVTAPAVFAIVALRPR